MTELNRSEKHIAEKTVCLLLLRGTAPDGQRVFAYVAVRADKLHAFMEAQQQPDFNPEDHGLIIESGIGDPPLHIRQKMEQEYGFNHEKMVFLEPDNSDSSS